MTNHHVFEGETWLALEVVAECYQIEVRWLKRVYDLGLLGPGRVQDSTVLIAASRLDRVAEVVRLHFAYGLELESLGLWPGVDDPDPS